MCAFSNAQSGEPQLNSSQNSPLRQRIRVTGVVQGVGFRPFVWQLAQQLQLTGWVCNDAAGVIIEIQGAGHSVDEFHRRLTADSPPLAQIESTESTTRPTATEESFVILASSPSSPSHTSVAPDVACCADCLREFNDPSDRRYRYPFINCTNCGPRFTIIRDTPYDRPLTSMKSFGMCSECQREYDDPANRRFHAQPNACPSCGPQIWFVEAADPFHVGAPEGPLETERALQRFQTAIAEAQVIAVKGVGGFHLACDAANDEAVGRLRERKGRREKPLAVMVDSLATARQFVHISEREQQLLTSRERPIVLLPKRDGAARLSDQIAPGNDFVGVVLPYSPLHHLLVRDCPLVMTSGNVTDEPIVRSNEEAASRLQALADAFLFHDRDIEVVCDDSVMRCVGNELIPVRRSRGFAPLPLRMGETGPTLLGVGGEIKSTFCLSTGGQAYLSQHIGDMGNLETLLTLQRNVEHFCRLFRARLEGVVADLHPGYLSAQWAESLATRLSIPCYQVQHHFAHVASLLAEHSMLNEAPIIGCCFDGDGVWARRNDLGRRIPAGECPRVPTSRLAGEFSIAGWRRCGTKPLSDRAVPVTSTRD